MNSINFKIMFEDEEVAHIVIENDILVKAETYTDIPYKQPLMKRPITKETIRNFLERRVIPLYRVDILEKIGIERYSIKDVLRKTHGTSYDDFTWVKFENEEISWNDVRLR